jgi:hypothetical protein
VVLRRHDALRWSLGERAAPISWAKILHQGKGSLWQGAAQRPVVRPRRLGYADWLRLRNGPRQVNHHGQDKRNYSDSTFFKHVFVLRVSDGQRSPGSRADHELKTQLTRYSGDEGNCAIGILAAGDLAFPLAEIKDCRSSGRADRDFS